MAQQGVHISEFTLYNGLYGFCVECKPPARFTAPATPTELFVLLQVIKTFLSKCKRFRVGTFIEKVLKQDFEMKRIVRIAV